MDSSTSRLPVESPFIVGIGASAGGLSALEEFFKTVPCDSGAVFVVIQHIPIDDKRLVNDLLERSTQMDVRRVTDSSPLQPDTVFWSSSEHNLVMKGGQLRLLPQGQDQAHFPIDLFFQSLAAEQGERTIGIILSGTGSDGSRGLKEISEAGGLVLAQDPKTAEFEAMPQAAIATSIIDLTLSPSGLAEATYEFVAPNARQQLLRAQQHKQYALNAPQGKKLEQQQQQENLQAILKVLETTNQEQETKNQKLITSNEELHIVNAEYQAEIQALLQLNNDFRSLYKNTPVMLHSIDRDGCFLSVSDYWLECLGYARNEVIGHKSTEFLTSESQQYVTEVILPEYFKTGLCRNVPYQFVCKDGSTRDILLSAAAERDENGDVNRTLAVLIDVTERNQAREDLTRYRDQLEDLVNERTEELKKANQQLQLEIKERKQIEQELAQRASDLALSNAGLEQFAYVVSHDLQEPLRAMTVFSQLLHQRYQNQLDETADSYIDNIVKGGIRMKAMIDGILALSRLTKKERPKTIVPMNLEQALTLALENLKVVCQQRQVVISQDPLPTLAVEQNHMVQLFQNLIGNAIKFCNDTPKIHITVKPRPQGYLFGIQDNGPGISTEDKERIFQLFQRLHTCQEHDGYGIGLAICKKIVQRYNGRIWLESNSPEGSTFYFTLAPNSNVPGQDLNSRNNK